MTGFLKLTRLPRLEDKKLTWHKEDGGVVPFDSLVLTLVLEASAFTKLQGILSLGICSFAEGWWLGPLRGKVCHAAACAAVTPVSSWATFCCRFKVLYDGDTADVRLHRLSWSNHGPVPYNIVRSVHLCPCAQVGRLKQATLPRGEF